jgi:hypothetical protein
MTENQIYSYRIPDSFFKPHYVVRPFYARVVYNVHDKTVNVVDVGLSIKCLRYINDTAGLATKIENELNAQVKKAINLNNMHPIIARALAPHVK